MARRRYISTEISVDARIAKLAEKHGDFAALLYTWMIPHAADDCTITGEPDELLMLVVPGLRSKTCSDVSSAVEGMVELGLIVAEGENLVFPPEAFYRYQTYISANNRRTPKIAAKRRKTPKIAVSLSPPPPLSLSPSLSPSVEEVSDLHARANRVAANPDLDTKDDPPFTKAFREHYQKREGKDPPRNQLADARDFERTYPPEACIQLAEDYDWGVAPSYLRSVMENRKTKENTNGRSQTHQRSTGGSGGRRAAAVSGPDVDGWKKYAAGEG